MINIVGKFFHFFCLQVHINLGAGEKELASARELQLNDLTWHEVNLTRRDAEITLKIDVIHSVSNTLPGRFFELNINFGVYIGGQGGFHELFLGLKFSFYQKSSLMMVKLLHRSSMKLQSNSFYKKLHAL